jgi:hypothetical protein
MANEVKARVPTGKRVEYEKALERIADRHGGELEPIHVIREAKKPDSVLHDWFEWDDTKAAHEYRIDQARKLIASVRITVEHDGEEIESRKWVHIAGDGNDAKGSFHRIDKVLENRELSARMEAAAKKDLEAFENRYRHVVALRKKGVLRLVQEAMKVL